MRRRDFIPVLGGAALVWSPIARAQQAGKVWRVGLVHVGLDHVPPSLKTLSQGLHELGYEEGKNIALDFRNVADEPAALAAAREFLRAGVDLIVAFEDQAMRGVKAAGSDIPVVFLHVADPVADRYVESLARPGNNATGYVIGVVSPAKYVELFAEIVPRPRRLLVLVDPGDPIGQRDLPDVHRAATAAAVELIIRQATTAAEIDRVVAGFDRSSADAVLPLSHTIRTNFSALLVRIAMQKRLAFLSHRKEWVEQGALLSYSADLAAIGRSAATYVDRILKGTKPRELPVQQPTKFELVINLKTAKALGLTIPPPVVARADRVIE